MTSQLLFELDEGVLTLTMNRPERRNALSPEMCQMLEAQLQSTTSNSQVRAIVLTGAGDAFCSGGDVKAMASPANQNLSEDAKVEALKRRMHVAKLLHTISIPTIAKIRGSAAGAGLSLAMACDLRIASVGAKLSTAFGSVALSGDYGGSYFLTSLVGTAKARELYFLSTILDAEQAERIGLVNRVVNAKDLDAQVAALARSLAQGPSSAIAAMKSNLNVAMKGNLEASFDAEPAHHIRCMSTADHREAVAAFVEKRAPRFG
ncbi:enoyl-CoA hydratase [Ottowia thiooxydans]|uniref:2-(1,2-epoxy-1,2-dihydrophenyl)acetyl-CoA isomerase n=1 Tax=Ottowia thiooxydans TaxID=219182 RepID=A0ABV2Q450_9BURK